MNRWRERAQWGLKLVGLVLVVVAFSGAPLPLRAEQSSFQLASARVLNQVLLRVINSYVDPGRIRPRMMLVKALEWMQQSVAEVQVRYDALPASYSPASCERAADCPADQWPLANPGSYECVATKCVPIPRQLTVQVDTEARTFTTNDVRGPWDLSRRMSEIFAFLDTHLPADVERPKVEYAAINGLLSTLDPHSNLLTPEIFEEMQLGTRGEFGGLGIVISMHPGTPCGGHLTVMEVMDGSPAQQVGLQRMDRIVRIADQPTTCMDLNEAVSRMRGTPGTSVRIWIDRPNGGPVRAVDLVRARIQIDSVTSRMLDDGVGYVKIENFQVNTTTELRSQLEQLRRQGMRSLVLDLRDDPGGLLDQAIHVVDAFISSGTIVITAGARAEAREVRRAEGANTEPPYPMVVLVNSGSASASEIVAGALRNHGRALLVGERTFGKGSVQTLYEFSDGSALKLTVAQYLTPGEESIQSVGIVPDVEFGAMTVSRNRVDLDPRTRRIRESDLERHFEQRHEPSQEAAYRLWLLRSERQSRQNRRQCPEVLRCDEPQEEPWSAEAVTFAQQLLARQSHASRASLLAAAGSLVAQRQEREMQAVAAAFRPSNVDWSDGQRAGEVQLRATVGVGAGGDRLRAGESSRLRVRVTNTGPATLYRLRGTTRSDNPLLHDHELAFGRLRPGQTRTWEVPICVPAGAPSRTDPVQVLFRDTSGDQLATAQARLTIVGLDHPTFAYGYQVVDALGNGDGRLQRGERAQIRLVVRNEGPGPAREAEVRLRNKAGDSVVVRSCRHRLGALAVGAERVVEAEVVASQAFRESSIALELIIADQRLREVTTERLEIPVAGPATALSPLNELVAVTNDKAPLREGPAEGARVVAWAARDAIFRATARAGDFLRLDLGSGRPGWIAASATRGATGSRPSRRFTEAMANRAPEIVLSADVPLAVRGETLRLSGEVRDPDRVLDMYIFVGKRKPFYLSNRGGATRERLPFSAEIPLVGGSNQVLIVARETAELITRRHLVIRRDNPDGSAIESRNDGPEADPAQR
jgi:carboxyl-terminal processing protease